MSACVTSFRMYASVPGAAPAWRALFARVFADLNLPIEIIDWPGKLDDLWREPDLCCALMCGLPFVRSEVPMQPIAAPVPSPRCYAGLARYRSEFLVRESSGWQSLEATFGSRIGWTAKDSQSGFNAPRAHLAEFTTPQRRSLYREVKGSLEKITTALDALASNKIDVVALDGFWLDLCRRHAPERLSGLRCVAKTQWTPNPLLVAAPGVDQKIVTTLREHLTALHTLPAYQPMLADVLLAKFVAPDINAYRKLEALVDRAVALDYETIR